MRVLLFTDTLGDVNGVSRFIRNAAEQALATSRDLRVFTSTNFEIPNQPNLINFKPALAMKMPGYAHLELAAPPAFSILRAARHLKPDVIHISTPGPVGAIGRLAARTLRVPMLGVYHTDFPAYIERLFDNDLFTAISRTAMRLFYRRFTNIFTRSHDYVDSLRALRLPCDNIVPLKPGIMTHQFHPSARDLSIWPAYASPNPCVRFLSVGRVSVEKNLPLLTRVWKAADAQLKQRNIPAELVVVGDGPYRAEMEEQLQSTRTRFLGFRYAEELTRIYASADAFLFPSTTDTLGQVVMESQAAGLPVIVSDQGGPKEVVKHEATGFVLSATDTSAWISHIVNLAADPHRRAAMGAAAHEHMQPFSMSRSFDHFWQVHEEAHQRASARQPIKAPSPQPEPQAAIS